MRHVLAIFCIVGSALGAVNALDPPLTRYEFAEPHMGTLVRITLFAADEATAKKAAKAAFERIEELNRSMSDYIDDSELMRLSKSSGGPPVAISEDLFTVLDMSQQVAELSGGAFDVTVGPVVQLWRRSRRTRELPQPEALKKALAVVGYKNLRLDRKTRTAQLLVAGMRLDVGGIAKGYAADMMLAVLRRFGILRAMIAVGGDIACGEPPPETHGWKIGVDTPAGKNAPTNFVLLLRNQAVSTAGDANQFVNIDGKRYSHIVDPHTGMGLIGKRSVTIVAKSGLVTDGFDTGICVMGRETGMKLVEDRPDLAGLFVEERADGELEITQSTRFGALLAPKE
jgi:FAD:protein FMN transferase